MPTLRDTKVRAQRIDLTYFRRPPPYRRWRRILSIAVSILAAAWVAFMALRRDERIYNSGPLATRHAMLETRCGTCHDSSWSARLSDPAGWQERLDTACLTCHDGPVHHGNMTAGLRGPKEAPTSSRCSQCHVEHKGSTKLAEVRDANCTACHADLKTTGADPSYHARISAFTEGHPEFALLAKRTPDPTAVAFNHSVHLHPDTEAKRTLFQAQLKKLQGRRGIEEGRISCVYCHPPAPTGAYTAPVNYEAHCRDCHPLKLKEAPVPHETPDRVRDFLRSRLAKDGKGGDALAEQVTEAEIPLFSSDPDGCMKCHKTDLGADFPVAAPVVTRTGIPKGAPRRWFIHSTFNHETHRELRCTECHGAAETSKFSADVLMPPRELCAKCHSPSGGVPSTCVTCHLFHDKSRERSPEGRLKIGDVMK
jgi:hypothetical protein